MNRTRITRPDGDCMTIGTVRRTTRLASSIDPAGAKNVTDPVAARKRRLAAIHAAKKKLGLEVTSEKVERRGRVYVMR